MQSNSSTAAIYVRVSSALQEDGTSLGTQEAACRAYAAERGYHVSEAHVYREVHSGGDLYGRDKLAALREAVRQGGYRRGDRLCPGPLHTQSGASRRAH